MTAFSDYSTTFIVRIIWFKRFIESLVLYQGNDGAQKQFCKVLRLAAVWPTARQDCKTYQSNQFFREEV